MGALTASTPKPLLEVGGETLIGRQLRRLAASGVTDVVINLSRHGGQLRAAVGDGSRYGLHVLYSDEPDEPLETAGGIVQALPLLGPAPFLVANADVVTDFDFARLDSPRGFGTLVLAPNPLHHPDGDYGLGADARLTRDAPRRTYVGIALLSPELFAGLAPGRRSLVEVFNPAIADGRLFGIVHQGLWIDAGTPERLDAARAAVTAGDG